MNCRIVGAICQHMILLRRKEFWSVFNLNLEAHSFFEKNEKLVTLGNFSIHMYPCFYLILNKITLNKTKNASDV